MLDVQQISKRFGTRQVLTDVSFRVGDGRLTGFVGGNGAGKTTTMRIILGLLSNDGGTVTLDGREIDPADRRLFGYMPEERGLYPKMRVHEHLVYLARLHGLTTAQGSVNSERLLEQLGLQERANDEIEKLSLGNQQRAQIAAALVHDPKVLVLDEPFSGLDPLAVDSVVSVLREVADAGAPVLFSSHQLDIVERLCDDIVIIAEGTIRAAGEREVLREQHATPLWEIETAGDAGWVRDQAGVRVQELDGSYALFRAESPAAAQSVLVGAVGRGAVERFAPVRPRLAEIFKEVIA
ncbi:MAG: ATP-binding cassette domain-containing protein [Microbacterium sp.]|nr:ATP-binding cassette domain-containing protein [Microbacterium sp.]